MPRKTLDIRRPVASVREDLVTRLAQELTSEREFGRPTVYEQTYATGKMRVVVIWDDWGALPQEERSDIILRAYERSFGSQRRDDVALATGVTVDEATAAGFLPYQVVTALRRDDPITREEARRSFLEEGASEAAVRDVLQLRFATEEEARACRHRLIARHPGTEDVWIINRETTSQDFNASDGLAGTNGHEQEMTP